MILPRSPQPAEAVADHYNELDAVYRALWGEHVHHGLWRTGAETQPEAVQALTDLVANQLAIGAGDRLVDIGCGYGATARAFAMRGANVTGYTVSARQAAQSPAWPGVEVLHADWLANDLQKHTADGAYAIESTEHMSDKLAFFRQAARVLKPGGRLVVCAWLAAEAPKPWQIRHLLEPICFEGRLPSLCSEQEYRHLAEQSGFVTASFEDLSSQVARTWTLCLRRFSFAMIVDAELRRTVRGARNRLFAMSLPRLMIAYRTGAMRYGIFTFVNA